MLIILRAHLEDLCYPEVGTVILKIVASEEPGGGLVQVARCWKPRKTCGMCCGCGDVLYAEDAGGAGGGGVWNSKHCWQCQE
ncbi:MAG: hypothetical protein AUG51_11410 [Acidobacteria bacterium 13_1_20CM_3_53_8]|nr:MAG: hypothetical protein AUG51_11410 [Acidobacteria bacterium 13_1_20CM_3_53_8]